MKNVGNTMPNDSLKDELHKLIDKMDEYRLRIVLGFVKKLFNPHD